MAGGDLLYILAFIILPTAVLVSCIWALLLLRKGVLLPSRPVAQYDMSHEELNPNPRSSNAGDPIEETGEHLIVAPATAAPIRTATESVELPASPAITPAIGDQTQEFALVPPGIEDAVAPDDTVVEQPVHTLLDESAAQDVFAPSRLADAGEAAGVLMVPFEESAPLSPRVDNGVRPPANGVNLSMSVTTIPDDGGQGDAQNAADTEPRRPARRTARLLPSDDHNARLRARSGQRRSVSRSD